MAARKSARQISQLKREIRRNLQSSEEPQRQLLKIYEEQGAPVDDLLRWLLRAGVRLDNVIRPIRRTFAGRDRRQVGASA